MIEIIGIRFRSAGKIYYFDPQGLLMEAGSHVIVETARGVEFGTVVIGNRVVGEDKVVLPLRPVIRKATEDDVRIYEENKDAVMADGRDFTSEDIAKGVPFVKKLFAEMAIGCRENPIPGRRVEKQIMISFGETAAIVSLPAEPFVEIGFAIREASRFPYTMIAALGMGEIGSVGLPQHYGNGGYETSPSRTLADRTVGENMIEGAIKLLK